MQDLISRREAIDALMEKDKKLRNINWYDNPYAEGECGGIDEALSIISNLPSAQPEPLVKESRTLVNDLVKDTISRQAAIDVLGVFTQADALGHTPKQIVEALPSAEPEPLSDAYMKSVWTWLLDYQINVAKLKGRYTPYEVLSWVANDWRKEHE